jgi:asparagine synthase (glutamine-hydrolysing)
MCGIYGELCLRPGCRPGAFGEAATDRLTHRGPDGRGTWVGDRIFLGARRLSIIDPEGGSQPMRSAHGDVGVVFNGEIYNFAELRRELGARGHVFRTRSDTEILVHAYEQWGSGLVQRLNGMFAFAVWDARARRLLLARDRVGEKPLYYYRDRERFLFASEIKAILANPCVPRRLGVPGLANFLSFGHAVAPHTMYENIRKLLPGHYLEVDGDTTRVARYWDVASSRAHGGPEPTESQYAVEVRSLLDDSVRRRVVADVPVGAFLSGGVDSTAVVALMNRHVGGPVKTFSLGFRAGRRYNELSEARRAAKELGTEHHELAVETGEVVPAVRRLVYHYDEPFADPAGLAVLLLAGFAREHVKVALTGDGGDELFGGYRRYAADQVATLYQRLPDVVTQSWAPRSVEALPRLRRLKRTTATLAVADPAQRHAAWLRLLTPELREELVEARLSERLDGHDATRTYSQHHDAAPMDDRLNRLMYVDFKTWLADDYMEKTDKATMAFGLEARMPLLDHRLVELAFRIPARYKVRGVSTKRILKQAMQGVVPAGVLRRRKRGFAVPIDEWLRGDLRSFAGDVLLGERARTRGYFDSRVVERLLAEHASGRHARHEPLWALLSFELWHRMYIDGERG